MIRLDGDVAAPIGRRETAGHARAYFPNQVPVAPLPFASLDQYARRIEARAHHVGRVFCKADATNRPGMTETDQLAAGGYLPDAGVAILGAGRQMFSVRGERTAHTG